MDFTELSSPASRQHVADHARIVAEHADRHAITLESMLALLRSPRLDDRAARNMAIEAATSALIGLRAVTDQERSSILEPVVGAFARLQSDLLPLVRFGDLDVQFVEPPATGRALPGEVAHAARAIVRSSVLVLADRSEARRVRIQWDCDGLNLLISIRYDGAGELSAHDDSIRPIVERVTALDGAIAVSSTPGWGSSVNIQLPLDPPAEPGPLPEFSQLSVRERDVLRLLASGARNAEIAEELLISVNTVKFHVSNLLRKIGARNRAQLIATAR